MMRREDLLDLFQRIPAPMHQYVNLVLHNQAVLTVDVVARFEPTYLVMRGREGGSTEEGRAFFVPYDAVAYLRIEQVLRIGDMKKMYGETGYVDTEDKLGQQAEAEAAAQAAAEAEAEARGALVVTPPPATAPLDP